MPSNDVAELLNETAKQGMRLINMFLVEDKTYNISTQEVDTRYLYHVILLQSPVATLPALGEVDGMKVLLQQNYEFLVSLKLACVLVSLPSYLIKLYTELRIKMDNLTFLDKTATRRD